MAGERNSGTPGPGKKRLFFALWPDEDIRAAIADAAATVIQHAGQKAVPAANYHITLAFLGAVSAASLADIVQVARGVRFLPFTLQLDRLGYWPRSQVEWLAPSSLPLQLPDLVDNLWNKLGAMGFEHDARQYRPHVTLSRRAGAAPNNAQAHPVTWRASSFVLVESRPGKKHPIYTVLEHFPAGA
jgi:2'-5' RNA ligase